MHHLTGFLSFFLAGFVLFAGCTGIGFLHSNELTVTNVSFTSGQPHPIGPGVFSPPLAAFNPSFVKVTITNNDNKNLPTLMISTNVYDESNNRIASSDHCDVDPHSLFAIGVTGLEPSESRTVYCTIQDGTDIYPYTLTDYEGVKVSKIEVVFESPGQIQVDALGGSARKVYTFNY
ncbi:hypothetical protein [Methanoregula sp.]|jgi:hypothetical protein|uniref:hypothetical protein n=1 Tax=Methanoregula sp. TaxID=2052170 RepID=UPI003C25A6EA